MSSLQERFRDFMESKGLSPLQLAEELGVQRSSISHILNGRNKPSLDFLNKLINSYPDIDIHLLISGTEQQAQPDLFSEATTATEGLLTVSEKDEVNSGPTPESDTVVAEKEIQDITNVNRDESKHITNVTNEAVADVTNVTSVNDENAHASSTPKNPEEQMLTRQVKKVILLYTDGSFEEYNS